MKISFWSLNIGLAWMMFVNLFPLGTAADFKTALRHGYWHARQPEFFMQPLVQVFEWLRLPGDVLFIVGGILPVVYLAVRMVNNRHRPGSVALEEMTEVLTRTE